METGRKARLIVVLIWVIGMPLSIIPAFQPVSVAIKISTIAMYYISAILATILIMRILGQDGHL